MVAHEPRDPQKMKIFWGGMKRPCKLQGCPHCLRHRRSRFRYEHLALWARLFRFIAPPLPQKSRSCRLTTCKRVVFTPPYELPTFRGPLICSDCDWAGVSLIVTEILLFGFQGSLSENLSPHIYKEYFQGIFYTLFSKKLFDKFIIL